MKDDCEDEFHLRLQSQGRNFPKNPGGHGLIIKGGTVKSLSCEVVTSAALFTRLMPRCTQERVNQV